MNLSTTYLGLALKNPLIPGASPLVDDLGLVRRFEDAGAAALVMPSLFEEQIDQEQRALEDDLESHTNEFAEALTYFPPADTFEKTCDQYLHQLAKIKAAVHIPLIASLNGTTPGGWLAYARQIQDTGADALELNYYDLPSNPADNADAVETRLLETLAAVRRAVHIPLAVKLSPFYSSLPNLAAKLLNAGANALVLFNRFYQPNLDIETLDTALTLDLSTSAELPLRLRWLALLSAKVPASYAITGGIHTATDVIRALMAGANAVQLVSALLNNGPEHLAALLETLTLWLETHEYETLQQTIGTLNQKHTPNPAALERANYLKILHTVRR